jgi:hypothetical protein
MSGVHEDPSGVTTNNTTNSPISNPMDDQIKECDLSQTDVSTFLTKFTPAVSEDYAKTFFKTIPDLDISSTINANVSARLKSPELTISSLIAKTPEIAFPKAPDGKRNYEVSGLPKINNKEEDIYLKIAVCKNKLEFLTCQYNLLDEYFGRGLETLNNAQRLEFLSTIEFADYVKQNDNIETTRRTITETFDSVITDTKFYESITGRGKNATV